MENPNRFVAIRFVVQRLRVLPWCGAAVPTIAGLALSHWSGHPGWAVAGVVAGVVTGALVRLAVEVVDLVAETLLPR